MIGTMIRTMIRSTIRITTRTNALRIALAALLTLGIGASAQAAAAPSSVALPTAGTPIVATFLDSSNDVLLDGVVLNTSPVGQRIAGIDGETYVTLTVGDVTLTFDTSGVGSKNTITAKLQFGQTWTLEQVVSTIAQAQAEGLPLQVAYDANGLVTYLAVAH